MADAAGIVLAGGRSSRMGRPKAALEWHGSTLLRRVCGIVGRAVDGPVLVVRAPGQELPELPDAVELVEDAREGRGPLQGLAAGLAAAGGLSGRAEAGGPALAVLGDSYSSTNWPFPTWPEQLVRAGRASSLRDYAVPGATAADGSNSFASQLRRWRPGGDGITVVYFGHNDVGHGKNLEQSQRDLEAGLATLADRGAGRLVVVIPHDWGCSPTLVKRHRSAAYRARSLAWRRLCVEAAHRHHAAVVDIFAVFERVFDNPRRYGFDNIDHPDRARSATTALYFDGFHFGYHGHQIIAGAIGRAL
jgi:lysophospholipase L1-like esterase